VFGKFRESKKPQALRARAGSPWTSGYALHVGAGEVSEKKKIAEKEGEVIGLQG